MRMCLQTEKERMNWKSSRLGEGLKRFAKSQVANADVCFFVSRLPVLLMGYRPKGQSLPWAAPALQSLLAQGPQAFFPRWARRRSTTQKCLRASDLLGLVGFSETYVANRMQEILGALGRAFSLGHQRDHDRRERARAIVTIRVL